MKLDEKRRLVTVQDIKLVKALAGNDAKLRDRALKNLGKWLELRNEKIAFTELEFTRIWKGLFYAMWMSDKPLVQEECAEKISSLIGSFADAETSLLFFKTGLGVIATEWFGVDQLRLDKFLMFVRRILRHGIFVLKRHEWRPNFTEFFGEILYETVLKPNDSCCLGLTMHVVEIFLEELAKVSQGEIDPNLMPRLLKPFVKLLSVLDDGRLISHLKKFLFYHLLQQSDKGVEYETKFQAWKGAGFPGGNIDSMVLVRQPGDSDSEQELDEQVLDPRAGQVDVILPQLKYNGKQIAKLLSEHKFSTGSTMKSRKAITDLAKKFSQISKGKFPLGIKKIDIPEDDRSTNIRKSVNRWVKFEKQLLAGSNRKRKLKQKKDDSPIKKLKRDETPPVKKSKLNDSANLFQKKLDAFVRKSEKLPVKKKCVLIKRNSGVWLVEPIDSPKSGCNSPSLNPFPKNEWDSPPKPGEVEIFVPSRKIPNPLLSRALKRLAKPRYSLDSNLVRNPFMGGSPRSEKKVKINLRLNSSQEIFEHHAQLRRSPAIPFDANKRPIKPLLKSNLGSPINPFCKRIN